MSEINKSSHFIALFFFVLVLLVLGALLSGCKENAATAIPRLKKELSSADVHTRSKAALSLAAYGENAQAAVPSLVRLLSDSNGGVRSSAAFALRSIGGEEADTALAKASAQK